MPATSRQHTPITPSRVEDRRLITGCGQYTHDVCHDGMLHAVFVRSPHAHARLARVDVRAALAAPGVHAVFIAADLGGACIPPINPIAPAHNPWPCPLLAVEAVQSVADLRNLPFLTKPLIRANLELLKADGFIQSK